MNSEHAFLDDIALHPDDDGPRLVFADWLEERSDPRCEFIRLDCQLAKANDEKAALSDNAQRRASTEQGARDLVYFTHEVRRDDLLAEHGWEWRAPLRDFHVLDAQFRRGFIEKVTMTARHFREQGEELLNRLPTIREVQLEHCWEVDVQTLFPLIRRIDRLAIGAHLEAHVDLEEPVVLQVADDGELALGGGPDELSFIAPSPRFLRDLLLSDASGHLSQLDYFGELSVHDLESLIQSQPLPHLTRLGLGTALEGEASTVDVLDRLAAAPLLVANPALDFRMHYLEGEDEYWERFVASEILPFIHSLKLQPDLLLAEEVIALATSDRWHRLRHLDFSVDADQQSLHALAASPMLHDLRTLRMVNFGDSMEALFAPSVMPHLPSLETNISTVSAEARRAMLVDGGWPNLSNLTLVKNTEHGWDTLAEWASADDAPLLKS